ncbi:MAG: exo-alpha-sialidase [Planctomycetaceae bacterium]|nr:exo-alpha-sialidase [Planctomycetaceae bacterium]
MKPILSLVLVFLLTGPLDAAEPLQHWSLDAVDSSGFILRGKATPAAGIDDSQSLVLDGASILEIPNSDSMALGKTGFTLTAWVNPYVIGGRQQLIATKNRYSKNEREWGVMIDKDGLIRLYAWQKKWRTIATTEKPTPGRWHFVAVTIQPEKAELWVNGKIAGMMKLDTPLVETKAPLTIGGINDSGRIWQTMFGAFDEISLYDHPLSSQEMSALYHPVTKTHIIPEVPYHGAPKSDPKWDTVEKTHASEDLTTIIFDGIKPDSLACDTTLRQMPDGSWVMIMLGGGHTEPLPQNRVFVSRSHNQGKTWSPMQPINLGVKTKNRNTALVPSELLVHGKRCTMFVATHDGTFSNWKEWMTHSDDSCRTWSELEPAPGRLHDRTFIRNHIVTRDGRILLPFQHYVRVAKTREISKGRRFSSPTNPRNGVLMSSDGGKTWEEHGDIRLTDDDNYHGWAENNIVELADGRIAMIIRADGLGGVLYYAESNDGGRTWPQFAKQTSIPNPGSKATLYGLGGDTVAILHNPNPRHRSPLSLWVSFDGMQTWPYQRVLLPESIDGKKGRINYPDGFVSKDKKRLHFAFDDNRHRAVYIGARLPLTPFTP